MISKKTLQNDILIRKIICLYYNLFMCKVKSDNKPKYEIQDIINLYGDDYIKNYKLTLEQIKAMRDISQCRTSAFGYNARQCTSCRNIEFSYNSCRNRNWRIHIIKE